jgi:hypothetical protein
MADEPDALYTPPLADVLNRLAPRDRQALQRHLDDAITYADQVADQLRVAESPTAPTLRQVEAGVRAAIRHLELATRALGLDLSKPARTRPWGAVLLWRRR